MKGTVRKVSDQTCDQSGGWLWGYGTANRWPLRHAQSGREFAKAQWLATKFAISEISPGREGVVHTGHSPRRALVAAALKPLLRKNPADGSDEVCDQ